MPQDPDGAVVPRPPLPGRDGAGLPFARICERHRPWAVDLTDGAEVPAGWVAIVDATLAALSAVLAGTPTARLVFTEVAVVRGGLSIVGHPERSGRDPHLEAIRRVTCSAWHDTLVACRRCGGDAEPGRADGLCMDCVPAAPAEPVPGMPAPATGFALYRVEDVAAALGVDARVPVDEAVMPDGTEHQARLRDILAAGEGARWRSLAEPGSGMLDALDDLDRRAPHLREATDLVRTHLRAALVMGLPVSFPPMLLVGEPGIGKSWYLARLARLLGVPFRSHPMNTSTLGEGLSGSHPSWRNARPGLVARTLLSEATANPIILVDEADKPPDAWREDPYRPFYALLEPEDARAFVDDYLGFPIDASRIGWVLAGNEAEVLPRAILDRLAVLRVPAMDGAQARAVVASIYEAANTERAGFFEPEPSAAVVDRLVGGAPRGIRRAVADAMARAAADRRRALRADDVVLAATRRARSVGFVLRGDQ